MIWVITIARNAHSNPRRIRDAVYGVRLIHHERLVEGASTDGLRDHFDRRVRAFRAAVAGDQPVVFVRAGLGPSAGALRKRLVASLPRTSFVFVAVKEYAGAARSVAARDGLLAFTLPSGATWKGDQSAWDWVVDEVQSVVASLPADQARRDQALT